MSESGYVQFKLRFPADLFEKVKQQAADNGRSIGAEIRFRVENGCFCARMNELADMLEAELKAMKEARS